jgi:3-carboxy-cis,cis-muconate cycloisomerase
VARDVVVEIVNFLAVVGGSLGKIALDITIMSSNELSEVSEPYVPHRGASSTMPQKRNPISSETILAASKILRSHAGLVPDGMVSVFERASGPWHLEWVAIPEAFVTAVGALHQTVFALSGLEVNTNAMKNNLMSTRGLIVAEAVMMGLAPVLGRQRAHEESKSLLDVLLEDDQVKGRMSLDELHRFCDPVNYLGSCSQMTNEVLSLSPAFTEAPKQARLTELRM